MNYKELYIVGIGASAGGFEALQKFLPRIPRNDKLCYVIAQHLDPKRPTLLGELLSKSSVFNVLPINNGDIVQSNHIYYCPPSKDVTIIDGKFILTDPEHPAMPKPSINKFFSSLAIEKKEKAIGIILSGTGSDGAKGTIDIADNGGIALTEDEGAKYYSMPKASIDTNKVIASLPPELLAEGLVHIIEDKKYFEKHFAIQDSLDKLFDILNKETNIDFTAYKDATITRRIKKRMNEKRAAGVDDYLKILESDSSEVEKLKDELLIIVTSFFRDKEAFEELKRHLKELIQKKLDNTLRIWVTACATGEEAFTMAMIISEILEQSNLNKKVTIFATDVSGKTIIETRNRYFTIDEVEGISDYYLDKYFDFDNRVYKPTKQIRDMIIFSKHDIIKDPPFLNVDMITCRNLLIYFNNELQKRILSIFYYAMRFDSILFLGKSETVGTLTSLFFTLNNKYKIYKKSNDLAQIDIDTLSYVKKNNYLFKNKKQETENIKLIDVDFSINKAIAKRYGFDGIVIDGSNYNILFYKGDCQEYLVHPKGISTNEIFKLIPDYLKLDLRATLNETKKQKIFVSSKRIRVMPLTDEKEYVTISIFPLEKNKLGEETYFITFLKEVDRNNTLLVEKFDPIDFNETEVGMLEDELTILKERLQITIEELETSNEELQSTNEELQSTNEELQSTNEELETSNEELQSTNEELQTVNDELTYSNIESEFANKAFNVVLSNLGAYVMILDKNLNIIKFTDGISRFFDMSRTSESNFSTILLNSDIHLPHLIDDIKSCINADANIGYDIEHNYRNYYFTIKKIDLSTVSKQDNQAIVLSFVDKTELIKQDKIIFQQSKMASMGEMIGNIAHQWRQPLNSLSATIFKHNLDFTSGDLDTTKMLEFKERSNKIIQKMSKTIDDFRGFFSPNKEIELFNLKDVLDDALSFVDDAFMKHNIVLEKNYIDIEISGYKNELIQVFLNILNNSKDAIKSKNQKDGKVIITIKEESDDQIIIFFEDNGGGIDDTIIKKIYEPYFTTKFQDQGTGIGLYMSKMIVEESLNGKINLINIPNGVKTIITLNKKL